MRHAAVLLATLCAVGMAGCGGSARPTPISGATVFTHECSYCHSLIGNESRHREGGDLLGYKLDRQQLLEQTRQMPVRHPLTRAELGAVVDYVQAMQRRARAG
jgi:hypothetical protein